MPLSLYLKPNEKVIIGNAVIQNGKKSASFVIHNKATILRQKDIMTEEDANSPAKRIYFLVQLMYLAGSLEASREHHTDFFNLTRQFLEACPTPEALELISNIGQNIMDGKFFNSLKECRHLMEYEDAIINGTIETSGEE